MAIAEARIKPVVLSGGAGSRLWPLSRANNPKQFLPILGAKSLFVQTLERVGISYGFEPALIVANDSHRFIAREQADKANIALDDIILEPVGRNTAPAVCIAALRAAKEDPEQLLLFLPSDHVILDMPGFHQAVGVAAKAAQTGRLCCFGMSPTRPETGYGYIASGEPLGDVDGAFAIEAFKEKPDADTAQDYVSDGGYSWNSGMFMFRAATIIDQFKKHQPEMLAACEKALSATEEDLGFLRLDADLFAAVPADSIDYAIMEKTDCAAVVPAEFGWSDVGSFSALADVQVADTEGNVMVGDVLLENSKNTYVHTEGQLVSAVGVEDLVIVATSDAVMVAPKAEDQNVKKLVDALKAQGRSEADFHAKVYRPWGTYRTLAMGERFQVKEIEVYPGKRLSLQKHHHRAEHWVIVEGSAVVTRNEEEILMAENESIYLPLGAVHRLENPGKITMKLIEVQSGSYLGEDDIVRLEDDFNREKDK